MVDKIWIPTEAELQTAHSSLMTQLLACSVIEPPMADCIDAKQFVNNYSQTVANLYAEIRFLRKTLHDIHLEGVEDDRL